MSVAASNHNGASDGITSQHSETTLHRTAVHDRCGDKKTADLAGNQGLFMLHVP